jgi:hypothetical protein
LASDKPNSVFSKLYESITSNGALVAMLGMFLQPDALEDDQIVALEVVWLLIESKSSKAMQFVCDSKLVCAFY